MDINRDQISAAFSTIWTIVPNKSFSEGKKQERRNKEFMEQLTLAAPLVSPDCWARYFLLILRQQEKFSLEPEVSQEEFMARMAIEVKDLVTRAPQRNLGLADLHDYFSAQATQHLAKKLCDRQTAMTNRLLTVHLQPKCAWAAKQQYPKSWPNINQQFSLEDCVQELNQVVSDPVHFLKTFDLARRDSTLATYVEKTLCKQVRHIIFTKFGISKFADWGLLRYTTKKELVGALQAYGLSENAVKQHHLIGKCFGEIYTVESEGQRKLPPPSPDQLISIRDRYNQRCQQFQLTPDMTETGVSECLQKCIEAIRHYRNQGIATVKFDEGWYQDQETNNEFSSSSEEIERVANLDEELPAEEYGQDISQDPNEELSSERYGQDISQDSIKSLMEMSEGTHFAEVIKITRSAAKTIFPGLEQVAQSALRLHYGLDFTQKETVQILGEPWNLMPQPKYSREFARWRSFLLKQLVSNIRAAYPKAFPENHPHDDAIQEISEFFKEYLKQDCKQFFHCPFCGYAALGQDDRRVLALHYLHELDYAEIAQKLKLESHQAVAKSIQSIIEGLRATLQTCTEISLKIDLNGCPSAPERLSAFIETWLMNPMNYHRQNQAG